MARKALLKVLLSMKKKLHEHQYRPKRILVYLMSAIHDGNIRKTRAAQSTYIQCPKKNETHRNMSTQGGV